jgi:tRNA modification GTPase
VSVATAFDGWPIELIDTAGLRSTDDPLERAGIERAQQQIAAADAVAVLFDVSEAWTSESATLANDFPNAIFVQNKIDLLTNAREDRYGIAVSAKTGEGIDRLIGHILGRIIVAAVADGDAVPFTLQQVESLRKAKFGLEQRSFDIAQVALASI